MTRLLVTGGAGFIGSHFIRDRLARHPDDVVVNVDVLSYAGSAERLEDCARLPNYRLVRADIADAAQMRQAMAGVDLVVHCAAETHVDRSITNATPFLRTNVEGTYVLLQAAREAGTRRFVHLSTDEVYGPILDGAVDEQAPLAPASPYAASKAAGDLLAQAFRRTHGLPAIIVRPTNIFGPGQFPEKFIPVCITNALAGRRIPLYGDGLQRRTWLSVQDACEALDTIIERGRPGQIYNLGSGSEQANVDTAKAVLSLLGAAPELIQFVEDRPGHDRRYGLDDAKLRALGWRPSQPFDTALRQTVAWYRSHQAWWKPLVQSLDEHSDHWLNGAARTGAQPPARTVG